MQIAHRCQATTGDTTSPPQSEGNQPESGPTPREAAAPPLKPKQVAHYCRMCGSKLEVVVPQGDSVYRHVCSSCTYVDYQNPKMVVGCIVEHQGKVLLCRRGIPPQQGLWTVPAGFMEMGESTAEGASRETMEEAGAAVEVLGPYCHFDIPGISQAYILFRARLAPPYTFAAQLPESLEARLFAPEEIPFDQLAFSSVSIALRHYLEDLRQGHFHLHHGAILKAPGSGPNDAGSFSLQHHFAIPTTLAVQ